MKLRDIKAGQREHCRYLAKTPPIAAHHRPPMTSVSCACNEGGGQVSAIKWRFTLP